MSPSGNRNRNRKMALVSDQCPCVRTSRRNDLDLVVLYLHVCKTVSLRVAIALCQLHTLLEHYEVK